MNGAWRRGPCAAPAILPALLFLRRGGGATFHWTWTGTNTGPGGTGKAVRISGAEEWRLGDDGLIRESRGHYDEAEYHRQMTE